jgi:hypothetical protein
VVAGAVLYIPEIISIASVTALAAGIIGWLSISTMRAFNKFDSLNASIKNKLSLINYFMVFARRFTKDELIKLGGLPDEDIKKLNEINDVRERIKTAGEKINNSAPNA